MKNIITETDHTIFSSRYVLSQVLIRSIKIAILNKAATRTTLKKLICTILYHWMGASPVAPPVAVKNLPAVLEMQETWVLSLSQEKPLEERMATTPILLPGESHGQRSMVGCSPWVSESDMTEATLHAHMYHWMHHTALERKQIWKQAIFHFTTVWHFGLLLNLSDSWFPLV